MLYLASKSPRRALLLQQLRLEFAVLEVEVPEHRAPDESPLDYVRRVARDKAHAGRFGLGETSDEAFVLGADTEVVLDDAVFGKPADADSAAAMLGRLSGRTHQVMSAVCLIGPAGEWITHCVSQVRFVALDAATIERYAATDEPLGKAGGYAIQGRGAMLVEHLQGSYSGVMGLPLFETAALLRDAGIDPLNR